ncbi:MAG TPA: ABC transporter substrate-binding protein [Alphaproteobacteria bacterium]
MAAGWTALAAVPLSGAPESGAPESGALAQLKIPGPPPVRPQPPEVRPEFRIGLLLAGGPYAASSDDIAAGLALALAEAGGGIHGRQLVILRDDGDGSPGGGAESARRLLAAASLDALVGPATSPELAALREVAESARVPLIVPGPGTAAEAAAKCSPYVLYLAPADEQTAGPLGSWVGSQKPVKHLYLLGPADAAGRSQVAAFKRQFEAAGGEIVGEEYVSGLNPDFSPYFAKLRLMGADTIYAPFAGVPADALVKQYETAGLEKRVGLVGAAALPGMVDGSAISAVDYTAVLDTPENQRFRAEFATRFGRVASEHAARGYDAGRLIVEALRTIPLRPHDRDLPDRETLTAALAHASFVGPRGPIQVDPQRGAAMDQLYIVRTRDNLGGTSYELLDRVTSAPGAPNLCPAAPGN